MPGSYDAWLRPGADQSQPGDSEYDGLLRPDGPDGTDAGTVDAAHVWHAAAFRVFAASPQVGISTSPPRSTGGGVMYGRPSRSRQAWVTARITPSIRILGQTVSVTHTQVFEADDDELVLLGVL